MPNVANVLIIDDDATIRSLLKRLVHQAGHRPWDAATSQEALVLVRNGKLTLDLILLDMVLPGEIGLECLHEIRRSWADVPVIVISGWMSTGSRSAAELEEELGISYLLPKPFDLGELSACLTEVLSEAS
jgi:adenylate cyclase